MLNLPAPFQTKNKFLSIMKFDSYPDDVEYHRVVEGSGGEVEADSYLDDVEYHCVVEGSWWEVEADCQWLGWRRGVEVDNSLGQQAFS